MQRHNTGFTELTSFNLITAVVKRVYQNTPTGLGGDANPGEKPGPVI